MNTNNIYDSLIQDPYKNIAFEKQITSKHKDSVTLFLWQNDKCVVIGRNQNALAECNLDYMRQNNIALSRRYSGGGAVYHDLGNVNYTLVMREKDYSLKTAKQYLFASLKSIGLDVEFSGRNDLTINGSKFSGQAYFFHKNMHVLHGTLMFDLNIKELGKCLTPSKKKLDSKGIKSVKSRVVNLKEVKTDITVDIIKQALIDNFPIFYGEANNVIYVDDGMVDLELTKFLQSDEWLYGQSPIFDVEIEKRFDFGNVVLLLQIKNNIVKKAVVYTDSLNTEWHKLEIELAGVEYKEDAIWKIVLDYSLGNM